MHPFSHRDFKFFGFFSVEFLEKSFDLHVFETFNISLFFFSISSFSKINFSQILEFLILNYPRIRPVFFFFFLPLVGRNFSLCRRFPFSRKESRRIEAPFESPMRIFSGIARLWSSLEKSLCRKDGRLGKEHDRGGEEKGRRAFACRVARLAEVQWPRVAPATVLFRRFSRKKNPALRFRTKSENGFLPQRLSRGFSILSLVHLLSLSLFLGWHAISSLPAPPTLLHRLLSNLFLPFNFRLHPARDGIFSPRTTTFLHPLPVTQTTTICASLFFRPLIFSYSTMLG